MTRLVLIAVAIISGPVACTTPKVEASPEPDAGTPAEYDPTAPCVGGEDLTVWPNCMSRANSDPWLSEHHDEIRELHPRVLALNFVNGHSMERMDRLLTQVARAMADGSRYHGYSDPEATPALQYTIAKSVDLTDNPAPKDWPYVNSTLYPRESDGQPGMWGFAYQQLFSDDFAARYGIKSPEDPSRNMGLCELLERGFVHEVWVYGFGDVPDVTSAEVLEMKPLYDIDNQRKGTRFDYCAGNGCFDRGDRPSCQVMSRILWVNATRGPGCAIHSLGHGIESMARRDGPLPRLEASFSRFANFDLDSRHGLSFHSFYEICRNEECLAYPQPDIVDWTSWNGHSGRIEPFDPGCGSVHFPPNARKDYDDHNPNPAYSTCEHYGLHEEVDGSDTRDLFSREKIAAYSKQTPDCSGGWMVYWFQSFPGTGNQAVDTEGRPIKSWWPYLFY